MENGKKKKKKKKKSQYTLNGIMCSCGREFPLINAYGWHLAY